MHSDTERYVVMLEKFYGSLQRLYPSMTNMRLKKCTDMNGGHLEHIL